VTQGSLDFGAGSVSSAGDERVLIAPGPRAAEALLLRAIAADAADVRRDPSRLATPLRVIVPSRSLREHVAARIAQEHGAAAGVVVQTLRGCARELLRRAREPDVGRAGDLLLPLIVRRHAKELPALLDVLGALDEGYSAVVETVRDLLDAGLDETNAGAAEDALAELPSDAQTERARAIVGLALRARAELSALGLPPPAALFVRATEALERDARIAHARALFVHGYADITGVQLALVKQLVALADARVVIDHPPDPTGAGGVGAFTARLRERLSAPRPPAEPARLPAPPDLLRAPGAHAEVRAVAERIRKLLDAGMRPESIAVVARNLQPLRFAIATHFRRLGVPFSGGPGFLDPAGRRLRALLALLEQGARATADRWLDAANLRRGAQLDLADLRLALHTLGRGRLGEVAALDADAALDGRARYRLPVRVRLAGESADDAARSDSVAPRQAGVARAERRSVSRESLVWARGDAEATLAALAQQERASTLADHARALRELTHGALRWARDTAGCAALDAALAGLAREIPASFALSAGEFRLLLERTLRDVGIAALGGRGGGVQVLSATAARARTFSQLFVIGLERDVFPRVVSEDPLLPDRLRRQLEAVLLDIPIKARGYAEERFLFAQLCAAADRVQLSWQATSDDGKERAVSPLVQRLRVAHEMRDEAPVAPLVWDAHETPRPAHEHAVRAGLARDEDAAVHATAQALAPLLGSGAEAAARSRAASLSFRDDWRPPSVLGPHLGQIGDALATTRELSVTRLEAIARCPWRAFLEKLLGLQPPPDALAALPELSPLLVGNAVHGALEEIVRRAGVKVGVPLAEALAEAPAEVRWPPPEELAAIVGQAARAAAGDDGILMPGFAELLARRAHAYLERVQRIDWPSGLRSGVRGAEVECALDLAIPRDEPLRVTCRADRVDQTEEGLALTDYKTGKPISDAKTAKTRAAHFLEQVVAGKKLQAVAYAAASPAPAAGRYLFAKPDLEAELAVVRAPSGDAPLRAAFVEAVEHAVHAWRSGELTPDLVGEEPDSEGESCKFCDVSEACWKGDAGAKRRLAAWRAQRAGARP